MPFSLYLLERRREQGRLTVTFEASSNVSIFLKPHSTPVGAYERVADRIKGHARKAMSCRGPLRLAGASIRETSIQARCCTVHADSDFQSALFEDSVQFADNF